MKKLLFFIVLTSLAFKLKAQKQTVLKPFEKLFKPVKDSLTDAVPNLSFVQQNQAKAVFLPKNNSLLIARLDHMPILKPTGNWNTPVVHPNGTMRYRMPVKRLPPVTEPEVKEPKIYP